VAAERARRNGDPTLNGAESVGHPAARIEGKGPAPVVDPEAHVLVDEGVAVRRYGIDQLPSFSGRDRACISEVRGRRVKVDHVRPGRHGGDQPVIVEVEHQAEVAQDMARPWVSLSRLPRTIAQLGHGRST
jgi:hypothetical protein